MGYKSKAKVLNTRNISSPVYVDFVIISAGVKNKTNKCKIYFASKAAYSSFGQH